MDQASLDNITRQVKQLFGKGKYKISFHVLNDHPERNITAADIIETIKEGRTAQVEPREKDGEQKYSDDNRFRWFGTDTKDRVLRLILVVKAQVIIVSAAVATEK